MDQLNINFRCLHYISTLWPIFWIFMHSVALFSYGNSVVVNKSIVGTIGRSVWSALVRCNSSVRRGMFVGDLLDQRDFLFRVWLFWGKHPWPTLAFLWDSEGYGQFRCRLNLILLERPKMDLSQKETNVWVILDATVNPLDTIAELIHTDQFYGKPLVILHQPCFRI